MQAATDRSRSKRFRLVTDEVQFHSSAVRFGFAQDRAGPKKVGIINKNVIIRNNKVRVRRKKVRVRRREVRSESRRVRFQAAAVGLQSATVRLLSVACRRRLLETSFRFETAAFSNDSEVFHMVDPRVPVPVPARA